jgi:hypothetical protein
MSEPETIEEVDVAEEVTEDPSGGLLGEISEEEKLILKEAQALENPDVETDEEPVVEDEEVAEDETPEPDTESVAIEGLDFAALGAEFSSGGLSEESTTGATQALAKMNFPPGVLDTYLAGLKAQAGEIEAVAYDAAGGKESYTAMLAWAGENLSEAETKHFEASAAAGTESLALAVRGVNAKFLEATGGVPKKKHNFAAAGNAPAKASQGKAVKIGSLSDFTKIQATAEYTRDDATGAAYRTKVHKALAKAMATSSYKG